jgi:predicted kinase
MIQVVLLCGLQAAGKSSFYRARFAATHVHVSKDLWPNVRRKGLRQERVMRQALSAGRSVVVDNTNVTVSERAEVIALAKAYGAEIIGYYFPISVVDALSRNQGRSGRAQVSEVAIRATVHRLEPPQLAEGFDQLYLVRAGDGDFAVEEPANVQ